MMKIFHSCTVLCKALFGNLVHKAPTIAGSGEC